MGFQAVNAVLTSVLPRGENLLLHPIRTYLRPTAGETLAVFQWQEFTGVLLYTQKAVCRHEEGGLFLLAISQDDRGGFVLG